MLIQYNDVQLQLDDKIILDHVDFKVNENDFIYLVGKVGTGKSSLLKSLYAELPVAQGEASILGFDLKKMKQKHIPALRQRCGLQSRLRAEEHRMEEKATSRTHCRSTLSRRT